MNSPDDGREDGSPQEGLEGDGPRDDGPRDDVPRDDGREDDGPRDVADPDESGRERHSLADLVDLLERERPLSPPAEADPDPSLWLDPPIDAGADDPGAERVGEPGVTDRATESDAQDRERDAGVGGHASGASDAVDALGSTTPSGDGRPSLSDLADRVSRRPPSSRGRGERDDVDGSPGSTRSGAERTPEPGSRPDAAERGRSRETALDLVADDPNVLLRGPVSCTADQHLCTELLAPAAVDDVNLLLVTFDQSAAERLAVVAGDLGRVPERTAVVSLGGSDRAGSTVSAPGSDVAVPVATVSNPSDLMKLGFAITKYLSEWESSPGRTLVCFHSLSDALRAADPKLVLRFLHVLQHQIDAAGARAHYHLDPNAHPSELVLTFTPLFETALDFDRDGSVSLDR